MKKSIVSSILMLFVITVAFASNPVKSADYAVDENASTITWTGSKITGSSHTGTVKLLNGEFSITDGIVKGGEFVIDMSTINCTDLSGGMKKKLEGHLKSEDFFGVEKHKTATLNLTGGEAHGDHIHAKGNLTIKGHTEPVELDITLTEKDGVFNASTKVTIDRTKFSVRYGSSSFFDDLGDKAINNEIVFNVELTGKKR